MIIPALFLESGVPKTGLSPTINIYDLTDNSLDVNGASMTEVAEGFYKYDFSGHDSSKPYAVICDSVTLTGYERYAFLDIPVVDAVGIRSAVGLATANLDTQLTTIDSVVDDILVDTGTTLPATLSTIASYLDTEIAAILADTGTNLPATLTTIEGKIDTLDLVADDILVDTGTTLPATLITIEGKIDTVDTVADAILVDTDTTLPAAITVVEGKVDAVIVDTGTDIPALIAGLDTKIDTVDTVVDSILALAELLKDLGVNKKEFILEGGVVYLQIWNDAESAVIYKFPYKDTSGNDIALSDVGKLAKQLASVV